MPLEQCPECGSRAWIADDGVCPACRNGGSTDAPEAPVSRNVPTWVVAIFTVLAAGAVVIGLQVLLAGGLGERCGGTVGCERGLLCVQAGIGVERRRCRRMCDDNTDCPRSRQCVAVGGSRQRACVSERDTY